MAKRLKLCWDYFFSREKKLQTFISGFHWLSELWLVNGRFWWPVFFCRCQTLGLHPEICWKIQSLEMKLKTTQNPSFPLPQKRYIPQVLVDGCWLWRLGISNDLEGMGNHFKQCEVYFGSTSNIEINRDRSMVPWYPCFWKDET